MLEYLFAPQGSLPHTSLGMPVVKTFHCGEWDDWWYTLSEGELHCEINENFDAREWLTFACPSQALAVSQSSEGLLLLSPQGYCRLVAGQWLPTQCAKVAQFFSPDGRDPYRLPNPPMSAEVARYFYHPSREGALSYKREDNTRD
jgi:hypothetical protein